MFYIEKVVLLILLIVLLMVCMIGFVTDHLLDMKVDVEARPSYILINFISICRVICNFCVISLLALGVIKLCTWVWGLIP